MYSLQHIMLCFIACAINDQSVRSSCHWDLFDMQNVESFEKWIIVE